MNRWAQAHSSNPISCQQRGSAVSWQPCTLLAGLELTFPYRGEENERGSVTAVSCPPFLEAGEGKADTSAERLGLNGKAKAWG